VAEDQLSAWKAVFPGEVTGSSPSNEPPDVSESFRSPTAPARKAVLLPPHFERSLK
jgi:hypothetical protein